MKTVVILFICLIFIILLPACSEKSVTDDDTGINRVIGDIDNSIIEKYVFLFESENIPVASYPVLGATIHGEQLFYWYIDSAQKLVIAGLTSDGNIVKETHIPLPEGVTQIGGLQIIENNYFQVIIVTRDTNGDRTVIYRLYDHHGDNISE